MTAPASRGYTQVQIAETWQVTDRTVRTYLRYAPRERKRPVRTSKVDPHKALIGEVLFERLLRLGYTGKKSILKQSGFVHLIRAMPFV